MHPWTDFEPTSKTGKLAAIYARVSRDDQVDGETRESIPLQIAQCQKYATEHEWETKVFQDINMSGFSDKRPGLQALLDDIRAQRIHTVIVQEPKRLGRDPIILETIMRGVLIPHGVALVGVMSKIDIATDDGQFLLGLEALISRRSVSETRRKSMLAKRKKALEGRLTSKVPYGYTSLGRNKVEIHAERAAVVHRVFDMLLEGNSLIQIARTLNGEGLKTAYDRYWNHARIQEMITQKVYSGQFEYDGTTVTSEVYPAIIPMPIWDRAQLILKARLFSRPPIKQHLLTGIVKCGYCLEREGHVKQDFCTNHIGPPKHRKTYYCCASRYHRLFPCDNARIRETTLVAWLEGEVLPFLRDSYLKIVQRTDHTDIVNKYHELSTKLHDLKVRRVEMENGFALGELSKSEYKRLTAITDTAISDTSVEQGKIGIALEQTEGSVEPLIKGLANWTSLSVDDKRRALKTLLTIVVYLDRVEVLFTNAKVKHVYRLAKEKGRTVILRPPAVRRETAASSRPTKSPRPAPAA